MPRRLGRVRANQLVRGERPDLEAGPFPIVRRHLMIGQAGHPGEWLRAAHRPKAVPIVQHRATRGRRVARIVQHRAIRGSAHQGQLARGGQEAPLQVVAVLLGQATVGDHKMEMDAPVDAPVIVGLHPADQLAGRAGPQLR